MRWPQGDRGKAYNKLAKSSIELTTVVEMARVAQMLEKAMFFHSALGMRAGLFLLTW
jgi:hypothetical protein